LLFWFITEALVNPQSGQAFGLFEAKRIFFKHTFGPTKDSDLLLETFLWSCINDSGESTFGFRY